jgi:transposase
VNRAGFSGDFSAWKDGVHGFTEAVSPEVRERAVRMVREWRRERNRTDGGLKDVAGQLGVHHESLRNWLLRADIDEGHRAARRATTRPASPSLSGRTVSSAGPNEILKSASAFFAREFDPRPPR